MTAIVRQLAVEDASSLIRCFEKCYGNSYPNDVFYDVAALRERISSGKLRSVAAFTEGGRGHLIGHTGLSIDNEAAMISEAGNTVVDPEHRGGGILGRMAKELNALCRKAGFHGYVHYPTTAHPVMQKHSVANGGVETGLMLDYIPAETQYADLKQPPGRIAATIAYQPFDELPKLEVYLPTRYASLLREIFDSCGINRSEQSLKTMPTGQASEPSVVAKTVNSRRGLVSIIVKKIGNDFDNRLDSAQRGRSTNLLHVDLPLDDPFIDSAMEILVARGFFFAGLLPHFRQTDVLRMQWCADISALENSPELSNPSARRLYEKICQDRLG